MTYQIFNRGSKFGVPYPICLRCKEQLFNRCKNAKYCKKCSRIVEKEYMRKYMKEWQRRRKRLDVLNGK